MPRSSGIVVENNFSKGLITEATGLNFPENAVIETENCVYEPKGVTRRRLGIDYEEGFTLHDLTTLYETNAGVFVEFIWNTVNEDGTISFLVQQVGDRVNFFTINSNPLSDNLESFTVDLNDYASTGTLLNVAQNPCSFSSGAGYLIIVHPFCEPVFVEYDPDTDTITTTQIDLKVRDFEGVDDGLDIDERPATLSDEHKYNLYNQGWGVTVKTGGTTQAVALTQWDTDRTDYPSNADVWYLSKNSNELFDADEWTDRFVRGTTEAPKGYFIYTAWDIDRDTALGTTGLPSRSSGTARPSCTAFFSGRVWYAGVSATKYNSEIYFSKIIENTRDFGKCYQNNDPTNEELFEILDSDGGVIKIPEIDRVVAIKPAGTSLIVFATNGIWAIYGANDSGFKATDFTVSKITTIGAINESSIVIVDKTPIWWNGSGIYSIDGGDFQGQFAIKDISKTTIQEKFNEFPFDNLQYVKGSFNEIDKIVKWLVRSDTASTFADNFIYDTEVTLDVTTGAFYINTFDIEFGPVISGIFNIAGSSLEITQEDVLDGSSDIVTVSGGDSVFVEEVTTTGRSQVFRYTTTGDIYNSNADAGLTYSGLTNTDYFDWASYDDTGISFDSFFVSGYRVRGNAILKQQSNYITVHSLQRENSSVFVQGIWDYTRAASTKRWSVAQQAYKDNAGADYVRRRLKIRGEGIVLQLKFYSEEGKPFFLTGWSMIDSINQGP